MTTKLAPAQAVILPIRIVLGALIFGMTAFCGVALFINRGEGGLSKTTPEMVELYGWILVGLGIAFALGARYVSLVPANPQMVASLDAPEPAARAMAKYFAETVARAGMAEGFGLLGAVFYFLTDEMFFLAAPLISTILLLRMMPTDAKVRQLLQGHGGSNGPGGGTSRRGSAIEP